MFKSLVNIFLLSLIRNVGKSFALFALLMANLFGSSAIAGKPDNVTKEEMATIPPYCPYAQSWDQYMVSPESKRWASIMGKPFHAIHHYCWAQINMQRALKSGTSEATRVNLFKMVRDDYIYVAQRSTPDFVLLPEIMSRLGEVEVRLSLINDANRSFATARKLKPDYWPAYSHWAEYLMRVGKKVEAKNIVKTGLEYSPTSRVLREQYRLLGGDPSMIKPVSKPEAKDESPEKPVAPESTHNSPPASTKDENSVASPPSAPDSKESSVPLDQEKN